MKHDRSKPKDKPARARSGAAPARGGARKPPRSYADAPPRRAPARPTRDRTETSDPYKPARRPARDFGRSEPSGDRFARTERPRFKERAPYGERAPYERKPFGERKSFGAREDRGGYGERGGRGFTVTLDPDVARVFRGDASVNRALRLVLQLMQVVQGPPPRPDRPERARGYQGSAEARGFERKPRFSEDDAAAEQAGDLVDGDDSDEDQDPEGTE
jgi:hypothetical protein